MIDFNKEFDLLQQYINYRVEWYATYLTVGRICYVNIDAIPYYFTPEGIFELYKQTGNMFYDSSTDTSTVKEHKCLTFEQFKEKPCYTTK